MDEKEMFIWSVLDQIDQWMYTKCSNPGKIPEIKERLKKIIYEGKKFVDYEITNPDIKE